MIVESRSNSKLKDIRRLRRCKGDRAILEGPHLVREALATGLEADSILVTEEFAESPTGKELVPSLPLAPTVVAPGLFKELGDADSPQGIMAVVHLPRGGLESLPLVEPEGPLLYLDGVQDPSNLGALARVAEAFGAFALVLSPGSAHPNHPRALRASAGSLLRLPLARSVSPTALAERFGSPALPWVALDSGDGSSLIESRIPWSSILVFGAEGQGISPVVSELANHRVRIPLAEPVESLNVAVAAGIVLFELHRRRP